MSRIALRFGRQEHLIGVIHEAENQPRSVGVLLWNTGISHRIGPFRVHVELAEKMAQLGFTVIRFDLSRLGDSDLAEHDASIQDMFTRDIHDAAQILEDRYQIKDMISIGICSGAVDAWYHARQDPRIRGLVMVDSFVYPTFRHEFQFFLKRIFSPKRWNRYLTRAFLPWAQTKALAPANDFLDPNYPTQADAATDTQKLVDRGTEMLVIYTGGFHPWYSYKNQFAAMLKGVNFKKKLQLEFWPDVDHLFSLVEDRKRFMRLVQIWIQEKFLQPIMALDQSEVKVQRDPELVPIPSTVESEPTAQPEPQPLLPSPEPVMAQLNAEDEVMQTLVLKTMNDLLYPASLQVDDNFFDYGGNSLLAIRVCQALGQALGRQVPITLLYMHLRPRELAEALMMQKNELPPVQEEAPPASEPLAKDSPAITSDAIAVIGYACKVPGARNVQEFWSMIREGREGLTHFKADELDASLPESLISHRNYVASRGVIDGDRFDHEFFSMNRREAIFMDPQQRVLMETCWQALEDAGWAHRRQTARIGVYAGVGNTSYQSRNLMMGHATPHSEEEFFAQMGNDKDYVATHIAYYLDLKGPAVSVHTACSTSLVAVVEGIKTLLTDEADLVLAGAASVNAPMHSGHLYQEGGIFSRDGHCRPFAADATGTLFSDGSAVVVLKRLDKALADGDPIRAVIHGWALNNDGRNKSSFAAPSVEGQSQAIAKAYERSGWSPRTVSYMECHGTATPIGDPIEIEGLRKVFQVHTQDQHFCALGSVKANIGHLTAAAGTIGLIKAALVLEKGEIPPALHAYPLNPELRLNQSPFHIPKTLQSWPPSAPRRAGVSSFGVGGTNSHVLLEAAPTSHGQAKSFDELDPWLTLSWSARDPQTAQRLQESLSASWNDAAVSAHDLCYTMGRFRSRFPHRQSVTGRGPQDWQLALTRLKKNAQYYPEKALPLVLMFPGQGSQYTNMGHDLAQAWPRFRLHYEKALTAFQQRFDLDLTLALDGVESECGPLLSSTLYTQPALFCLEWALAQSLLESGLKPAAVMGHSIGEIAAATVAGVFRFDDAVHLVYHRARVMQSARPGTMLAVRAPREKLQGLLPQSLNLCVINSNEACVVGGERADVDAFMPVLKAKGIAFKALDTSHAFHSAMMDEVLDEFRKAIQDVPRHKPSLPIISTVTAQRLRDDEALSLKYWVDQIRQPVNFMGAVQFASTLQDALFVEAGPRDALSRFVQQILREEGRWPSLALLPKSAANGGEDTAFAEGISEMSNYGVNIFVPREGRVISAPVYPFQGERLWAEPKAIAPREAAPLRSIKPEPGMSRAPSAPFASDHWLKKLSASLAQISGLEARDLASESSWVSLGLDSLLLTQWSLKMQKEWGINMNVNMLQNELQNLQALAAHLQSLIPQETPAVAATPPMPMSPQVSMPATLDATTIGSLLQQQMTLMNKQIELLTGLVGHVKDAQGSVPAAAPAKTLSTIEFPAKVQETAPEALAGSPIQKPVNEPLPGFLNRLVHEGEIEFANDHGVLRMPRYRGSFLALDSDGQPGLFIENPDQLGEYWQIAAE
ncbi:MAG TPA: beta-ketoacyl synthase N-terminal-like domain-containing protein [Oligoflexus sp.]|uniref:polyketide synthase n=1 Tax=Oligoflexus sp. TaxID=1971216 RepID=UPI002D80771E|nr:polyketide synthase [Oligoflexus sp.]HET9235790.1 beta-ketoacyl synthase N-terminal-like domain-containing protein [Oligoflexus sp.]